MQVEEAATSANFPTVQFEQAADAPLFAWYMPTAQLVQLVAPVFAWKVPTLHGVQPVAFVLLWYCPTTQLVQSFAPEVA